MQFLQFKGLMAKAKPGQHLEYHRGNLAEARAVDPELDRIARFCEAMFQINTARIYQKRVDGEMVYFVTLTKRLRTRKDQSGSFQDAERLMELI